MYCIHCGKQIPQDGRCAYCGALADKAQSVPPSKKRKLSKGAKLAMIICGAAAILAAAAMLYFFVIADVNIQKKFIDDTLALFENAFKDLSSDSFTQMLYEPFELNMGITIKSDIKTEPASILVAVSYDEEVLAANAGRQYNKDFVLLLIEDTLYLSRNGYDCGIKYDTYADLSKKMSLGDRLKALGNDKNQPDNAVFTDAFINSIPYSCFSKNDSSISLTLTKADLEEALARLTFMDKDKQSGISGLDYWNFIISSIDPDALIVITLSYTDDTPAEINIKYSDKSVNSLEFIFAYKQKSLKTRTITLDLLAEISENIPAHISIQADITNMDNGVEYTGSVEVFGIEALKFTGEEKWQGASFSGDLNLDFAPGMYEDIIIKYHGILSIGMPEHSVINEYRYYIDTDNAYIIDSPQLPTEPYLAEI
ncbi:MAG: hypothetical protein WDA65_02475 [Christensenellales bacterium]